MKYSETRSLDAGVPGFFRRRHLPTEGDDAIPQFIDSAYPDMHRVGNVKLKMTCAQLLVADIL